MTENEEAPTKGLFTYEQAQKRGIECSEPDAILCPHCDAPLAALGIVGFNGSVHWISHVACTCTGAVTERENEEALAAKHEAERLERGLLSCGVKKRFFHAQINRPALAKFINSFAEDPGCGVFITGPSRAGKTYCASALAKAFYLGGYKTVMTTSLQMLDDIKASFDDKGKDGIARYVGADVLLIDDLGKENANSWVMTTLFQIVNARYEAMRPTIVTSQYTPDELTRRMSRQGEHESAVAITARLKETCWLVRIERRDDGRLVKGELREP